MKRNDKDINNIAVAWVLIFYVLLLFLILHLMKNYFDNEWNDISFWLAMFGVLTLTEVLKVPSVKISKPIAKYISIGIIETANLTILTAISLLIMNLVAPFVPSMTFLILLGFFIIFTLYELIIKYGGKLEWQKEYRKYKKKFEDEHNMVNILTIPSTIITIIILAKGIESDASFIMENYFLSLSIIYVLLLHYCWKNRLN